MEFLGQGSDLSHSFNLRHSCGHTGSFNPLCWARDGTCVHPGVAEMLPIPLHHSRNTLFYFFSVPTSFLLLLEFQFSPLEANNAS